MNFERWDVVVVPYPFIELVGAKRRPALILTDKAFQRKNEAFVAAMITTARSMADIHDDDIALKDYIAAGLKRPCVARLSRIATLKQSFAIQKLGQIAKSDRDALSRKIKSMFGL